MNTEPNIVVSSLDLQRLENLLAGLSQPVAGIDALRNELDRADVLAPQQMPSSVVTMNSTVAFAIEESGERFELTLCYPVDAGKPNTVSILAPVGSALLGLAIGQSIDWSLPGGKTRRVRVIDIVYQPERAGNFTQ
ncbi:MAG: nucleoside diphosphate kinase regulator [Verrucomicrobiaceae bacterium]|nr:nucleoside diphosphate kinase regulator [Verrucomicrobiaceae bacterium]